MRRFLRFRITVYLLLILSVGFASGQAKGLLTNKDISDMLKGGIPESTIVLSIQQAAGSKFDTSPTALIQLRSDGATEKILDALVVAGRSDATAAGSDRKPIDSGINNVPKATAEDVVGYFSVSLVDGNDKKSMKWAPFNSKTYSGKTMIPYAGLFFKKDTYNKIPGKSSDFKVTNRAPEFELTLISGVQAPAVVLLVKLEETDTARKIMVSQQGKFRSTSGIRSKDVIPSTITEVRSSSSTGFSLYSLKPSASLKAGEYAIVVNGTQFYDFSVPVLP